jgi:hypothetical protein
VKSYEKNMLFLKKSRWGAIPAAPIERATKIFFSVPSVSSVVKIDNQHFK